MQKQRITLARAFLRKAPILILDEATSSLDNTSERIVQNGIDQIGEDKTVVAIAHRLSTIKDFDEIIVLEEGKIVEYGNHNSLMQKSGVYKNLIEIQS